MKEARKRPRNTIELQHYKNMEARVLATAEIVKYWEQILATRRPISTSVKHMVSIQDHIDLTFGPG